MTINQQITWLGDQLRYMKSVMPKLVASGRLAEVDATHRIACAQATLETLTQLRGIVAGKGNANV
jgi:hypothetical protein